MSRCENQMRHNMFQVDGFAEIRAAASARVGRPEERPQAADPFGVREDAGRRSDGAEVTQRSVGAAGSTAEGGDSRPPTAGSDSPSLLLIHGAWHGPWVWEELVPELELLARAVHMVELPSIAKRGEPRVGMLADAKVVRQHLDAIEGPVVVVAHSYGGLPITQAAAGISNVVRIIYLAAFLLDVGESLLSALDNKPPWWWIVDDDIITPRQPRDVFYNDMAEADAARAIALLRPTSYAVTTDKLTAAAWHTIPCTYVVCEQDRALPTAAQEAMAMRANNVRRLPTSHSPFLSRPRELVRLIGEELADLRPPDAQ
jgi:pimeloyl-ACP methyl ester carboxylesterase